MIRIGGLRFPCPAVAQREQDLRSSIRSFLAGETFVPRSDAWLTGHDLEFSRRLADAGFVGMTIPKRYGGHGRSFLERYVVIEELLAAGAPVAAHWFADRQVGPLLLRHGTEAQRMALLPKIASGRCFFSIGMSEPGAGSDLAAIRTHAEHVDGRFIVRGHKIWTSHAHRSDYMLTLCRTDPPQPSRRHGLSQLVIDLRAPGVDIRPIALLTGEDHFSEVFLDGVEASDEMLIGTRGGGWDQVISELAYERSGPERVLTTFPLLVELVRELGPDLDERQRVSIGRLLARTVALRRLSRSLATDLDRGSTPASEAALVKDAGSRHEQDVVETTRLALALEPRLDGRRQIDVSAADAMLAAPGFTLRGGTNEILRGIVSRAALAET